MQQLNIYSSSAGSGKTYTLTKEYLKLALGSEKSDYFKQILAITFTNDAAGEMKDRILTTLQGFADENSLPLDKHASNRQMLQAILTEINATKPKEPLTEAIARQRAARVFSRIIHEYSDFAVSTIDSFTNRVVSAFTEELELPYNYEVSLDINDFIHHAVDRLIDRVGGTEAEKLLTDTLEAYILEKAEEGLSFRFLPSDLSGFARENLVSEKVADSVQLLRSLSLEEFREIRERVTFRLTELETQATATAQAGMDEMTQHNLSVQLFAKGIHGIGGYFEKLTTDAPKHMSGVPTEDFRRMLDTDDWAGFKAKVGQKPAINALQPSFREKYNAIEALKQEHLLLTLLHKNLYRISVLNEIEKELNDLKTEKNMVHISDFNKKVIQVVLSEPVPFIYERLGEKYNHILIDEFQDTSSLQWHNLLPLIANSLGKGNFNMLVGDAKQAIYGWRGGDLEQLVNLTQKRFRTLIDKQTAADPSFLEEHYQTLNYHIRTRNLNTNYRSKAEIIRFNNDFFRSVLTLHGDTMPLLQEAYETFEQQLPANAKYGGHVEIEFISQTENPPPPEPVFAHVEKIEAADDFSVFLDENPQQGMFEDTAVLTAPTPVFVLERNPEPVPDSEKTKTQVFQENMLNRVLQLVRELLGQGFGYQDIALLSRNNKDSRAVAFFLAEHDIPVVSSDSLQLASADAVRFMVAFFQVMHRPANALLKYECLHLFHEYILEKLPDEEDEKWIEATLKSKKISVFFRYFRKRGYPFSGFRFSQAGVYDLTERFIQAFKLLEKARQAPYLYRFLDVALEFSLKESTHLADFLAFWEQKKEKLSISTPATLDAVTVTSIHKAKGLEYPVVIVPFANWKFSHHSKALLWTDLRPLHPESPFFGTSKLASAAFFLKEDLSRTVLAQAYDTEKAKLFTENLNTLYVALTRPIERLYLLAENAEKPTDEASVSLLLQEYLMQKNLWQPDRLRYVLQAGTLHTPPPETAVPPQMLVLEEKTAVDWQQKLWQKRHPDADFILDAENFDKQKEHLNKLCQLLKKMRDATEAADVLQKMFFDGIVEKSEKAALGQSLADLLALPGLAPYFSPQAHFIPEKQILHHASATTRNPDRIVVKGKTVSMLLFRTAAATDNDLKIFKYYDPLLRKMGYTTVEKITVNVAAKSVTLED